LSTRLFPYWPNVTPVAAIALYGGAFINRESMAFILPIAALLISNLFRGFHSTMHAVYIAMSITVVLGIIFSKRVKTGNIMLASPASSVIFFLITNFAS